MMLVSQSLWIILCACEAYNNPGTYGHQQGPSGAATWALRGWSSFSSAIPSGPVSASAAQAMQACSRAAFMLWQGSGTEALCRVPAPASPSLFRRFHSPTIPPPEPSGVLTGFILGSKLLFPRCRCSIVTKIMACAVRQIWVKFCFALSKLCDLGISCLSDLCFSQMQNRFENNVLPQRWD